MARAPNLHRRPTRASTHNHQITIVTLQQKLSNLRLDKTKDTTLLQNRVEVLQSRAEVAERKNKTVVKDSNLARKQTAATQNNLEQCKAKLKLL